MAQVIKKTRNILNAYLTLGVLENNKKRGNEKFLSQTYIKNFIDGHQIPDKNYIGRFIKDIKQWLMNSGYSTSLTNQLIKKSKTGFKLIEDIDSREYEDYVALFLFLALIEDDKHKDLLGELRHRDEDGEKLLSLITKLVVAKRKKTLSLKLIFTDQTTINNFKPNNFSYKENDWWIEGKDYDGEKKIKLSQISSIEIIGNPT